jgi:hypothetical protein
MSFCNLFVTDLVTAGYTNHFFDLNMEPPADSVRQNEASEEVKKSSVSRTVEKKYQRSATKGSSREVAREVAAMFHLYV